MIGLGRMGANMARRLARAGIHCVVHDTHPDAVSALAGAGHRGRIFAARSWSTSCRRRAPSGSWCPRRGRRRARQLVPLLQRRATSSSTAAIPFIAMTSAAARRSPKARHPLSRCRHQRRRGRTRARLLPDDRRRRPNPCDSSIRSSRRWRPASMPATAHAGPRRPDRAARLSALRAAWRRPLREDDPQRHRVRRHGRLCRRPEHPAQRRHRQARARQRMPRPRRCEPRRSINMISTCRRSPRCGATAA